MLQKHKWLALALAGALSLSMLAGCTETQAPVPSASSPVPPSADSNPDVPAPDTSGDESAAGTGNVLVVYYSASGKTEAVANYIAEAAGGDLFEITPAEPYTDEDLNWTDENSRVTREHEDESLRDVALTATEVENWDSYDTVFIGYPIWWGIAAWPVDGFVEANDFTGKTVIPFCTSSSSGLGESGALLAELAGSGDWQDGERFRSGVIQEDVAEWVDSLGLSA
ncbi:MAG TPA: flavodoxin [Pseudoflavonifractor capillosus]|uniref:Flavodoxin n=1 Tax=Pseudoflavonifractor capillosus TaxID=106588 RepID=A0A921SST4_9FIRM|nr:flavodoxin [Pseudoflavonifractor capillosus]HJG86557.1 flavodoxin [Pseudoflavonifractor capillosus]